MLDGRLHVYALNEIFIILNFIMCNTIFVHKMDDYRQSKITVKLGHCHWIGFISSPAFLYSLYIATYYGCVKWNIHHTVNHFIGIYI